MTLAERLDLGQRGTFPENLNLVVEGPLYLDEPGQILENVDER